LVTHVRLGQNHRAHIDFFVANSGPVGCYLRIPF